MKENTAKQIKHYQIINKPHVEVYAYRSASVNRLLVRMTLHLPQMQPISFDMEDTREWRRRRKSLGKLIGFEKQQADVTVFFYKTKKLTA